MAGGMGMCSTRYHNHPFSPAIYRRDAADTPHSITMLYFSLNH